MRLVIFCVMALGIFIILQSHSQGQKKTTTVSAACQATDHGFLPDPKCTPGLYNRAVTQATIKKTICVPGWTATIRPPVTYTEPLKFKSMRAYGDTDSARNYEFDHLVPLELGGDPSSLKNLWPEPHGGPFGSYKKDGWENKLRAEVCNGTMKLAKARSMMVKGTWINGG